MSSTRSTPDRTATRWTRLGSGPTIGAVFLSAWALYITVVTASNLSDLISSFGWAHWAFRSGNLDYIAKATEIYVHNRAFNQGLLAVVIVWEATAALLLWTAAAVWARGGRNRQARARLALTTLAMLWFAFAISTELFVAYDRGVDETVYWALAIGVLSTLLLTEVLQPLIDPGSGRTRVHSPLEDRVGSSSDETRSVV